MTRINMKVIAKVVAIRKEMTRREKQELDALNYPWNREEFSILQGNFPSVRNSARYGASFSPPLHFSASTIRHGNFPSESRKCTFIKGKEKSPCSDSCSEKFPRVQASRLLRYNGDYVSQWNSILDAICTSWFLLRKQVHYGEGGQFGSVLDWADWRLTGWRRSVPWW